jgi:DNA polymerase III psi subunit
MLDIPQESTPLLNEKKSDLLGGYQSKILLLVSSIDVPYLQDDELQLLTNMLNACKLSLVDVGILNVHHLENKNWSSIIEQHAPEKAIVFGEITEIGMPNKPKYQFLEQASLQWIHSISLSDLNQNPAEKKELWFALKKMFNITP